MKRPNLSVIALGTFCALASTAAFAADTQIKSDEMRASKIIGSTVYDRNNQSMGSVKDIVIAKGGQVEAVIVDVGGTLGVGGKNVALKMSDIKTDHNRLTVGQTKDQLAQAPSYQLENSTTGAGQGPSPVTGGNAGR